MKLLERLDNPRFEPELHCSFIGTALAIGLAAASVAGGVGSALIGSSAANKAANTQANAANYAADLQKKAADDALAFQKQQFDYSKSIQAPFIQTGTNALSNLGYLLGINPQTNTNSAVNNPAVAGSMDPSNAALANSAPDPNTLAGQGKVLDAEGNPVGDTIVNNPTIDNGIGGSSPVVGAPTNTNAINPDLGGYGSLLKGFDEKFTAPTEVNMQNDPGYLARLAMGEKAIQASAAAKGNLFTGGTGKALTRYASDYGSNEYGNVYNRAFNEYANRFNVFNTNQTNQYNRLANTAGLGQTSATQLGYLGQQAAQNSGNISLNTASAIGNDAQNAAAARGSGYVGSANAWTGALNNGMNNIQQLLLLSQLGKGSTGCWVARELYGGWLDPRTIAIRRFLFSSTIPRIVRFAQKYTEHGQEWAAAIQRDPEKRARFRRLFDGFLTMATSEMAVA